MHIHAVRYGKHPRPLRAGDHPVAHGVGDADCGQRRLNLLLQCRVSGLLIHEHAVCPLFINQRCVDLQDSRHSALGDDGAEQGIPLVHKVVAPGANHVGYRCRCCLLGAFPLLFVAGGDGNVHDPQFREVVRDVAPTTGGIDGDVVPAASILAHHFLNVYAGTFRSKDGDAGVEADIGDTHG